jgi:pyridoxamine-phosphate oxidase
MDAISSQPSRDKFQVLPHTEYITLEHLTPTNVAQNPLDQFRSWFKEAVEGGVVEEPEAMSLSTATLSGIPSARIVLLKQVDSRGFVFFTNYTSRKSQEITANPYAALVFYWREVHRSVRVVGSVEKLSREESNAYFRSRPVGSQLGAWASKQSTGIEEGELEERLKRAAKRFGDGEVPLPNFGVGGGLSQCTLLQFAQSVVFVEYKLTK